jgi:sugar phosphate isomerase/epimerase
MKIEQVAAQLYTLRDFLETPDQVPQTLRKVREIGYSAVQLSGVKAEIPASDFKKIIADAGLICCATHEPTTQILDEPMKVVERLKALDCKYTAVAHPGAIPLNTPAEVSDFARRINASGKVLAENGLYLTYHNHANEFYRVGNENAQGKTVLDIIYDETDPKYVGGEPDTYWVQYGGGDPVELCRKLKGRLPLIHLKDYTATLGNQAMFCEVGYGNLNFPEIVREAEASGCEWFIVEQDTTPGDPFDSLKMSYDYIAANLVS